MVRDKSINYFAERKDPYFSAFLCTNQIDPRSRTCDPEKQNLESVHKKQ